MRPRQAGNIPAAGNMDASIAADINRGLATLTRTIRDYFSATDSDDWAGCGEDSHPEPPETSTVHSCPECGTVLDVDYDPVPHDAEVTARIDAVIRDGSERVESCGSERADEHQTCATCADEGCASILGDTARAAPACVYYHESPGRKAYLEFMAREAGCDHHVPLAEQIRLYGERIEAVLDEHVRLLQDPWYRTELIMEGARRLIGGYVDYKDAAYRWGVDTRDRNMIEEDADWGVYGTTGDFTHAP